MKHFDYVEWLFYKKNLISQDMKIDMEEHLYDCDECMEVFLSLIDEEEIQEAGAIISDNFIKNTMDSVDNIRPFKKPIKKKSKSFNEIFMYYVAVASVTIILTAGGLFSRMVDSVPQIGNNISQKQGNLRIDTLYNLSLKIANMTSSLVNDFEFKIVREEK
ncbi:hypothetical protein [Wansuia hejianensis]|uniref:Zinc-finger domain-containing protein n=1 Tax=Wansuia hejianensis TaxID=2763667 RepID=A0A926EYT4_9FIRM|nr:hypothetical protein [Wansuia hejianensis]MBC8590027.1 hypothetical protein [Wansuia hejianensis]